MFLLTKVNDGGSNVLVQALQEDKDIDSVTNALPFTAGANIVLIRF